MKPETDNFVRVFDRILDSSIANDYETRHFFEDMLKLADWRTGVVDMTPEAISRRLNLPLEKVMKGIEALSSPDAQTTSPLYEGRRIVLLDAHRTWGWLIVNYDAYRAIRTASERREYCRNKMREWRAKKKGTPSGVMVAGVAGHGESEVKQRRVVHKRVSSKYMGAEAVHQRSINSGKSESEAWSESLKVNPLPDGKK